VRLTVFDYDAEHCAEISPKTIEECLGFRDTPTTTWINVDGVHQVDLVERLATHYQVHPVVLAGIVNTAQRPKVEDMGNYLFITVKMLRYDEAAKQVEAEHVSLIVGPRYVLSFQERPGDVFEVVRERLRTGTGRVRKEGADYLAYALIDLIVDAYFTILERLGERVESLEQRLVSRPEAASLRELNALKREMIYLRKTVWPVREVAAGLERGESPLIAASTRPYLRDLYDHAIHVIDTVETFRDMLSGMLDLYLSSASNRMNEIMKVLTIIATLFIPLTFLAGVYGMNFKYMPELDRWWAYPAVLGIMLACAAAMVAFFRRRGWL
jgi:magnesium transporter